MSEEDWKNLVFFVFSSLLFFIFFPNFQNIMACKTFTIKSCCLLFLLLVHNNFDHAQASRPLEIFHPPGVIPGKSDLMKPRPPSIGRYVINRYKKTETEAFRPTTPGHSPGVGHQEPPSAPWRSWPPQATGCTVRKLVSTSRCTMRCGSEAYCVVQYSHCVEIAMWWRRINKFS